MILKLIGAILVISGCGGFGILIAVTHKKELKNLELLLRSVDYVTNELRCRLTPLPELCRMAADISDGAIGEFFIRLRRELNKHISPNASVCTSVVLQDMLNLPLSIKIILQELGDSLGRFDVEGQLNSLGAVRLRIEDCKANQAKDLNVRLRSYQTLGLCAGAALAILLV